LNTLSNLKMKLLIANIVVWIGVNRVSTIFWEHAPKSNAQGYYASVMWHLHQRHPNPSQEETKIQNKPKKKKKETGKGAKEKI